MKPVIFHRRAINHRLDKKWDWQVAIWFNDVSMCADCVISSAEHQPFDTKTKCVKNMNKVLSNFLVIEVVPKKGKRKR